MKIMRTSLIASCLVLVFACNKDKDDDNGSEFAGTYNNLKEDITYIFDSGSDYQEKERKDTVSFTIEKIEHPDSANYIAIRGVSFSTKHTDPSLRFDKNGVRIVAKLDDVGFAIPKQTPVKQAPYTSMSIEGDGAIENGKLVINYHSTYQSYTKHGSISE